MNRPRLAIAAWLALALAGLVVAVGVAYAASLLASPDVGLTSEPLSAGAGLAPRLRSVPKQNRKHHRRAGPAPTPATPPSPQTPSPTPAPPTSAPTPAPGPSPTTKPSVPPPERNHSGGDDHRSGGDD